MRLLEPPSGSEVRVWAARCLFDIYKSVTFLCTAQCIQIAPAALRRAPHFSQGWIWASLAFPFDLSKNTSKQTQLYELANSPTADQRGRSLRKMKRGTF